MKNQMFVRKKCLKFSKTLCLTLILFLVGINTPSTAFAQSGNLTVHMNGKTVKEVVDYIEKNSSYIFVYSTLDTNRKVNVQADNSSITVILDKLFEGTNTSYQIDDRQIILKEKGAKSTTPAEPKKKLKVKGIIKDQEGEPLIGVNIQQKGSQKGTITNLDGSYELEVPSDAVLTVSYLGFDSQEIQVADKELVNVTLVPTSTLIDEVVVTALGMKRETKSLGYSVQEVKSDALVEARENNVLNSLSGKLAGVEISHSGNGPGGSSRVIIRGNNSIGGNNQPLVVVDGIPINNFSGGADSQYGGEDKGNGLADINPDDIESVSVLKGAAAAALYGSRAGNGVLMVTTKKGTKSKGLGVTLNSNLMVETLQVKPIMQNQYGQGSNGVFDSNGNYSWGPKMEGQSLTDWTGAARPFNPYSNDITDYLGNGVTTNNSVSVNAASDKVSFLGTVAYMRNDGSIPTSTLDRTNISLRTIVNLSDKLSFDAKINYIKQTGHNRPKLSGSPENVMLNYLMMPRSVHYSDLEGGKDEAGNLKRWTTDEMNYILNPYFSNKFNTSEDQRDRFIGLMALEYSPFSWLNAKFRIGQDMYWNKSNQKYASGTPFSGNQDSGDYSLSTDNFLERNMDALITASKDNWWESQFSGSLSLGGNMMYQQGNDYSMSAGKLSVPDFYTISNGKNAVPGNGFYEKAVNSIYGFAQLSYGNFVYLDLTARNDWSSTLPKENRSFFYPSVGLGWSVSDMLRTAFKVDVPEFISFAKIRASYAEVGNDAAPYQLLETYGVYTVIGDIKGANPGSTSPLSTLKPELIKSTELGLDFRLFDNRLGIDFAWYKKDATNQILGLPVSSTTGKLRRMINAGSIQNKGIELILKGTPVKTRDFQWDVTVNYSKNENKINELHPEAQEYMLASTDFINVVAVEGGTYGDMFGRAYQRKDGRILVDDTGLPLLEDNLTTLLGNYQPKWIGGISNHFTYKDFTLGFLIDIKWKGNIFINSLARGAKYGTTEMTLAGREAWYAGTGGIVVDGVTKDGAENTKAVNPQDYWNRVSASSEEFLYDASSIRLRELTFGYSFPKKLLAKTPFTSLKLSLVGRNLWLIKSNIPGFDPESCYSTGNGQGIEYGSMPSYRTFGFNLNVSF